MNEFIETPASRDEIRLTATAFGWTVTELPNNIDVYSHPKVHRPDPDFPKPDFPDGYPEAPAVILWRGDKQFRPTDRGWEAVCISLWSAHFMFDVDLGEKEIDFSVLDSGEVVVFPPQPDGGSEAAE